jgi:hypothetical protein
MKGKQTFDVPNDSEGREFLRLLKKFKAPGHSYRARGRGPRKAPGDNYVSFSRQMNLPHPDAESFAVYMGKRADTTFIADSQLDYRQQGLLGSAERGELIRKLTPAENELLTHAIHSFIDDHSFVMTDGEHDMFEELHSKLDLDK